MSNGAEALARLNAAKQALELRWQSTRSVWMDAAQRDFEREHLAPLSNQVTATQKELERLLQVIAKARQQVH